MKIRSLLTAAALAACTIVPSFADDGLDNPSRNPYY